MRPKTKKLFHCPICGADFWLYPKQYKVKTKYARVCSKKCARLIKTKSEEYFDEIVTWYLEDKLSAQRIGQMLKLSHDTVRKFLIRHGIKIRDKGFYTKGEKNANYKRGYSLTRQGYCRKNNRLIHRIVMEEYLGRKLKIYEHVHHLNGNKQDNRLENLAVMNSKEHNTLHAKIFHSWRKMYQSRISELEARLK